MAWVDLWGFPWRRIAAEFVNVAYTPHRTAGALDFEGKICQHFRVGATFVVPDCCLWLPRWQFMAAHLDLV